LEVCRYVVLNPVRAKSTSHPRYYKWASPSLSRWSICFIESVEVIVSEYSR
jgi:hypothetical protein